MKATISTSLPKLSVVFTILIISLLSISAYPQVLGLEPPSADWRIIRTPYAEIIFEKQSEAKAHRTANLINYIAEMDSSFIGGPAQYVPIILHSQSTFPAGVPNLAPWRSDWSLAAPQDPFMGAIPWIDGLSIHEYRHHQQMTRAKHGWFSDILRVVLGQTGWYVSVLTIQPNWFFEGDATYSETVLTNGGRGRMPKFDREYRTMRLSGLDYSYEKASRNSRKDFVPNIYRHGYYLTSFARKYFGTDIWTRVLEDTYKRKGFFYPFNRSLKALTGFRTKDLYNAAMKELDSIWVVQDKGLQLTESKLVSSKPKKVFTDYKYPYYTPTEKILTEKSSLQQIRTYYLLDAEGNEERLFEPGNVSFDHVNLSLSGDLITWAENRFHPRWDLKDYSVIFSYNFNTGNKKQLTHRTRYYNPVASRDGEKIIVLELKNDASQQLVILDGKSGSRLQEFPSNSDFGQFAYPTFSKDGKHIISGYTDQRGNTLRSIDIDTGVSKDLIEFSDQVVTRPLDGGDYIYFSGTHTGINNIFALHKFDGQMYQVTSSRFGAHMPSVSEDGSKMVFSEYTAKGFEVREMDLDINSWILFKPSTPSSLNYYQSLAKAEGGSILQKVPNSSYESQKFNSITKGLFKFHSWTPSFDQNEYGLEILSNNIMTNTSAALGYRFNVKETTSVTYGRLSYGALFPIFDLGYSYNVRNSKDIFDDQYVSTEYDWRENVISGGIRIPLRLSSGTYSTNLEFGTQYDYLSLSNTTLSDSISQNKSFGAVQSNLQFSRIKSRTKQQIRPRWGQTFSINHQQSLENQDPAKLFVTTASLFFPGLNRKHSFFLAGSYQEENLVNTYRFENRFQNARGYQERYFSDNINTDFEEIGLASINYFLPIAFPDIDFGSIAYFYSITANLFYDHSEMNINGIKSNMRSTGLDIGFEFTGLRLFRSSLILRGLYRFDQPDPNMNPFLFDIVFEITDLAF
jgi:hypothetical protein